MSASRCECIAKANGNGPLSQAIKIIMNKLRTFTSWYTKGLPGGRDLRVQIGSLDDPEAFFDAIEAFFEKTRSLVA